MQIVEAVVAACAPQKVPVTLKMRMGWDHNSLNAPRLAVIARESGIRMVTVHGRTRCQFYTGTADWKAIRAVKEAVSIPVIASGGVSSMQDLLALRGTREIAGAISGRALYDGAIDLRQALSLLK